MTSTVSETRPAPFSQTVAATYRSHTEAEAAVRSLIASGLPAEAISIAARSFETQQHIQGVYRPVNARLDSVEEWAWAGGLFGLLAGATGFFVIPVVGALIVLGPLSEMIAGLIGGAGVGAGLGALIGGLTAGGIPEAQALKYQARLQAGEFLVVVHGRRDQAARAHEILENIGQTDFQAHRNPAPGMSVQNEKSL
jgi:hypothetical protein